MKYDPRLYGKALAEAAAGALDPKKEQEIIRNFMRIVMERGDDKKWPKILAAAEKALREKEGRRKITIETARAQKDVRKEFSSVLKPSDIIEEKVDPEMIAGVKVTIDDSRQFDGSLARKMAKLFDASARF
jgi:F0F1-type ATP synthase delta subunit